VLLIGVKENWRKGRRLGWDMNHLIHESPCLECEGPEPPLQTKGGSKYDKD